MPSATREPWLEWISSYFRYGYRGALHLRPFLALSWVYKIQIAPLVCHLAFQCLLNSRMTSPTEKPELVRRSMRCHLQASVEARSQWQSYKGNTEQNDIISSSSSSSSSLSSFLDVITRFTLWEASAGRTTHVVEHVEQFGARLMNGADDGAAALR